MFIHIRLIEILPETKYVFLDLIDFHEISFLFEL